jgi:hypothetical protein
MDNEGLPPQTDQERRAVHAELAYLRTFSEVYRQHLKIYTEDVLRTIEDWESKERAAARDIPVARDVPVRGPNSPGIR